MFSFVNPTNTKHERCSDFFVVVFIVCLFIYLFKIILFFVLFFSFLFCFKCFSLFCWFFVPVRQELQFIEGKVLENLLNKGFTEVYGVYSNCLDAEVFRISHVGRAFKTSETSFPLVLINNKITGPTETVN